MPAVVLENIRSAYNVWNIIRTADAFWFDIIISWYTPSPSRDQSVLKTSLWAEKSVKIFEFWNPKEALTFAKDKYGRLIAAEITKNAKNILDIDFSKYKDLAIIFGNEKEGVLKETLELVDEIIFIPMIGKKESLNVWQAAAIFMFQVFSKLR